MLKRQMYGALGSSCCALAFDRSPHSAVPNLAPKLRQTRFKCSPTAGAGPPWLGPGPTGCASPGFPPLARAASRTRLAIPWVYRQGKLVGTPAPARSPGAPVPLASSETSGCAMLSRKKTGSLPPTGAIHPSKPAPTQLPCLARPSTHRSQTPHDGPRPPARSAQPSFPLAPFARRPWRALAPPQRPPGYGTRA